MPRPAGRGGEVRRDGKIVATEVAMQIGKVLGALGLCVLASCGGGGSDDGVAITEVPLAEAQKYVLAGDWGLGEGNTRVFIVRSADEWNQAWEARKALVTCPDPLGWNTYFCASPAPPPIDFERYSLVGIVLFGFFFFDDPNPRRVEDDGRTLSVSYRYYSSGHPGVYAPGTRFFLVPRTTSALQVKVQQCGSSC